MASTVVNTTLQVATLSIPVAVKKITAKKDVELGRATLAGNAIARPDVDSVTGEKVTAENIQKGVWEGDTFKPISADSLAEIDEATKIEAFEISEFVPLASIPWERATDSYFIAPQRSSKGPSGAKAMALLHRGLKATKSAGVMKIAFRSRQQLAIVYPKGNGLYLTTLAWAEDFAQAAEADILGDVAVEKAHVDQAVMLIKALSADDPQDALDSKVDDLRAARQALVDEALLGKGVKGKAKKAAAPVQDSMEAALEASLAAALAKTPTPA
jgi:DNA end-binding protein Ku